MRNVRRVVTGHDENGRSLFLLDGPTEHGAKVPGANAEFFEVWNTNGAPASISASEQDPTARQLKIPPSKHGTIIRVVDVWPGENRGNASDAREVFERIGSAEASTWQPDANHPLMHRTQTIDYGIVLEGEIFLILDESETLLMAGDIVVQRGTNHAWENRSKSVCRMAFILVDGKYEDGLAQKVG